MLQNCISLALLMTCIFLASSDNVQPSDCTKFVQKIIEDIKNASLANLPLAVVMYSGITNNNPGQKYECENIAKNYSYYLADVKNTSNNIESFTGLCVPSICSKEDVEIALQSISINCKVYDFPKDTPTDLLLVACLVLVGVWVGALIIWSIILSCKEESTNQYLVKEKKHDESVNSLEEVDSAALVREDFKLFNFYEGYSKVYKLPKRKNIMGPIYFLAVLSILLSTEFSYRQAIAANEFKSLSLFESVLGIFVCNTQIAFSVLMYIMGMKLAYSAYKQSTFQQMGRYFFDHLLKKWLFLLLATMSVYIISSAIDEPLSKMWSISNGVDCPAVMWQMWFLARNLILDCKVCLPWLWLLQADILLSILSAPLIVIFRAKKIIGYSLMVLIIFISVIVGYAILDNQGVLYEPYKIFNMQKQFTINFQTSSVVRAGPYFLGLIVGLLIVEGLEKLQGEKKKAEYRLAKNVRRVATTQYIMHFVGITVMVLTYLLISPYLGVITDPKIDQTSAYLYLSLIPLSFLIGLTLFILPSFWQGESSLTVVINRVFSWSFWSSLDKLSLSFYIVGPIVIGFTTYSMQNSIYLDLETVIVYFLGDCVIIYVLGLLLCAGMENQLNFLSNYLQAKIFGSQSKYSVLVIED